MCQCWLFWEPVDAEDVPEYYDIVKVWAYPLSFIIMDLHVQFLNPSGSLSMPEMSPNTVTFVKVWAYPHFFIIMPLHVRISKVLQSACQGALSSELCCL